VYIALYYAIVKFCFYISISYVSVGLLWLFLLQQGMSFLSPQRCCSIHVSNRGHLRCTMEKVEQDLHLIWISALFIGSYVKWLCVLYLLILGQSWNYADDGEQSNTINCAHLLHPFSLYGDQHPKAGLGIGPQ